MIIDTENIDDFCKEKGDCRDCPLMDDGQCTYRNFMECYEEAGTEVDDYMPTEDPFCYFCGRPMKAGKRRWINAYKLNGQSVSVYVCLRCHDKLKKYEIANNLKEVK